MTPVRPGFVMTWSESQTIAVGLGLVQRTTCDVLPIKRWVESSAELSPFGRDVQRGEARSFRVAHRLAPLLLDPKSTPTQAHVSRICRSR